jgi:hypothetical protein
METAEAVLETAAVTDMIGARLIAKKNGRTCFVTPLSTRSLPYCSRGSCREYAVASSARRTGVLDLHGDMGQVGEFGRSLPVMRRFACP